MKNHEKFEKVLKPTIKKQLAEIGIVGCELNWQDCTGIHFTGLAHSKRRRKIKNNDELSEVILACGNCHFALDTKYSHEETEQLVKTVIRDRSAKI